MAISKRCLFIAFAMATITQLSAFGVHGAESNCRLANLDLNKLYLPCKDSIVKEGAQVEPSEACCKAFKEVDLPCCCKHIPQDFEDVVSMAKFAYVAKKCGRPLESKSKCGSKLVHSLYLFVT